MSLIFDALGRDKETGRAQPRALKTAQADAVLATLGYSRRFTLAGSHLVRRVMWSLASLAIVTLATWVAWRGFQEPAPQEEVAERAAATASPSPQPLSPPIARSRPSDPVVETDPTSVPSPADRRAPVDTADDREVDRDAPPLVDNVQPPPGAVDAETEPRRPAAPADPAVVPPPARPTPSAEPAVARSEPELPAEEAASRASSDRPFATAEPDYFALAVYYHRAGEFDRALVNYRAVIERNELNAEAHNNLGLLYHAKGLSDDAISEFQRAIFIDGQYAKAHNNLGVVLLSQGGVEEAAAEFRMALTLDPANAESMVNLALAQRADGQLDTARATLLGALDVDTQSAPSHYNLALIYDETGDASNAIEHYRSFLQHSGIEHAHLVSDVRTRIDTLSTRRD